MRVIIFNSFTDVENYVTATGKNKNRRIAFENSCQTADSKLRFTCRGLLKQKCDVPAGFHFDFGFVSKPGVGHSNDGYCFHSPFSNKSVPEDNSHLSFFDARNLTNTLGRNIKNGKEMNYNVILHSIPYYPEIVRMMRLHENISSESIKLDNGILYNDAKALTEKCKDCKTCQITA